MITDQDRKILAQLPSTMPLDQLLNVVCAALDVQIKKHRDTMGPSCWNSLQFAQAMLCKASFEFTQHQNSAEAIDYSKIPLAPTPATLGAGADTAGSPAPADPAAALGNRAEAGANEVDPVPPSADTSAHGHSAQHA